MIRTVCCEEVQKGQKCAQAGVMSGVWLGILSWHWYHDEFERGEWSLVTEKRIKSYINCHS